ncbi:hypothetical protein TVAG_395060 [Trichomonas vaginalis G3]|uniref:At4g15545-like C-terminal domain-containing protein n=1 Tax=Trichomonas vaginalis (strain ATCC PRA-98 / G3) TaxID=412133 RepID=A2EDH0_TRIV3|nr:hypothetical protein TVAGG3_0724490 [Trichomonas vaginalis G3]EAY09334.1 hypothetical protein TVAG_395060 [Trichomonas vaginalis G3]KAI5510810.1 hypothetical protein TVAGG3_0724490 [Trichomonas vaginalis G3]|eukprot:XP_001321557.1 hypothetical protein [Trichomonas vaginalis G3]
MIESDSNEQLDAAVNALQIAIENSKQQRSKEVKLWQKRTLELQNQVTSLQSQLSEAVNINTQLQSDMNEISNECEKLRKINNQLAKQLKEKEQEIAKYNQLNQSLRTILDGGAGVATNPVSITQLPTNKSTIQPLYEDLSPPPQNPKISPISPKLHKSTTPKRASTSKSGQLLQKAKEQLTYSDFNLLIQEIQRHNNSNCSNAETLKNIKQILGPQNENLYKEFASIMSE